MNILPAVQVRIPEQKVLTATVKLLWYDLWVGAYVDTKGRALYVCPLPCVVVKLELGREEPKDGAGDGRDRKQDAGVGPQD